MSPGDDERRPGGGGVTSSRLAGQRDRLDDGTSGRVPAHLRPVTPDLTVEVVSAQTDCWSGPGLLAVLRRVRVAAQRDPHQPTSWLAQRRHRNSITNAVLCSGGTVSGALKVGGCRPGQQLADPGESPGTLDFGGDAA